MPTSTSQVRTERAGSREGVPVCTSLCANLNECPSQLTAFLQLVKSEYPMDAVVHDRSRYLELGDTNDPW